MRSDIVRGGVFPDYQLPDHQGNLRTLRELQGEDPLILTLARGHFCPKEHQQHLELAAFYPKVLKPGLVVHSIYNGYWFWGRPSVADLWGDLRELTREIRPDWDLSSPGLRAAWDAGDFSPFHGWNRRPKVDSTSVDDTG